MKRAILIVLSIILTGSGIMLGEIVSERIQSNMLVANENVVPVIEEQSSSEPEEPPLVIIPENTTIQIIAAGDLMFHIPQIKSAERENGSYDFSSPFMYIKEYIQQADIAIANLETVIAREGEALKGFPRFNSPPEVLDAIKDAGFDILVTANNHTLDRGRSGIENTIDQIESRELDYIGTSKAGRRDFLIVEKEGIKIAFFAYTFGLNGLDSLLTQDELDSMVNLIDKDRIASSIKDAEADGAEITIIYLHWGNEYQREASQDQHDLARMLVENGADLVLGSHPHVVQGFETFEAKGNRGLVVYSMGNLISNQRYETMGVSYTEDGLMISAEIEKNGSTGEVAIKEIIPIATWVHRYESEGRYEYRIIPVADYLEGKLPLKLPDIKNERVEQSYRDTMEHIYIYK